MSDRMNTPLLKIGRAKTDFLLGEPWKIDPHLPPINLGGEYDFTDNESLETAFDLEALLNFSLPRSSRPTRSAK
ncbi:hypothetical protein GCM10028773_10260 [Spirosoma koreense]